MLISLLVALLVVGVVGAGWILAERAILNLEADNAELEELLFETRRERDLDEAAETHPTLTVLDGGEA